MIEESGRGPGFVLALGLLIVLAIIGGWDVYALWYLPIGSTVSHHLRTWARELPALPLAVGLVLGHLFFPLPAARDSLSGSDNLTST